MREQRSSAASIENSARLLFKPLEPFLVDDRGDHKHPGRVSRSSLEALWNWVRRDLLPKDADILANDLGEAQLAGDRSKTERLARFFQDRVAAAIEANFSATEEDERIRRRTLQQIGTPRAGEELAALKCALKGRDVLASLSARLPLQIGNLAGGWSLNVTRLEPACTRRRTVSLRGVDGHESDDGAVAIDPAWGQGGRQRYRRACG